MDVTLQAIASEVSKQLTGVESRLGGEIAKQLSGVESRLAGEITKQLVATEERLAAGTKVHREAISQDVKLLAEGYGATLEGIERELADLNRKFDTKFADHDLVLTNHSTRIAKLEKGRPGG